MIGGRAVHRGGARARGARAIAVATLAVIAAGPVAGGSTTAGEAASASRAPSAPPQTGFERSDGRDWTTHDEELAFLAAVARASGRVRIHTIGTTEGGRPLHLVVLGHPRPPARAEAIRGPVQLHICTQHGNEPAGREACLVWLRDLAFTDDAALLEQMQRQTIAFVPTVNPDGREADTRGNADGTDINRDHLNVTSPEARAIGRVVRDWRPSLMIDHHEYGPGEPVLYDDDVLYLWSRNLNVHPRLRALGRSYATEHLAPCLEEFGYSSDTYGLEAVGDTDLNQTAGDHDEGIARNTAGLRHAVGILIESAVSPKAMAPTEAVDGAENRRRRVASHDATIACTMTYARATIDVVHAASIASRAQSARGRGPVYFDGQDEDTTLLGSRDEPTSVADPAPCAYRLTAAQHRDLAAALRIHGATTEPLGPATMVPLAQPAGRALPLLLDERARRHAVQAAPMASCPLPAPKPMARVLSDRRLAATGLPVGALLPVAALLAAAVLTRGLQRAR